LERVRSVTTELIHHRAQLAEGHALGMVAWQNGMRQNMPLFQSIQRRQSLTHPLKQLFMKKLLYKLAQLNEQYWQRNTPIDKNPLSIEFP
jgi:hypothetical protein